jgi:hypothetical protein
MFMIEDVTSRSFPKEGKHMSFRHKPTKKPLISLAHVSSSPRADPTPQQQQNRSDWLAILVRLVGMNRGSLLDSSAKSLPLPPRTCLDSYLACVAPTMPLRQGCMKEEKSARNSKWIWRRWTPLFTQTWLLPLWALRKERATLLLYSSKDMPTMRTLIPRIHLLPILALLTWGLTLSLVVILDSKVPPSKHHLLQSSQDLAWKMSSLLGFLVPHTPIWLVVPMHLFIILLCRLSLTHHSTSGQERIRLHHMTTSHPMISGIQGLNPLWTPSFSLFDNCWQRGRRIGLKPQDSFLKVQGAEKIV